MELNFTGTDLCAVNGTRGEPEARYGVVVVGAGPAGLFCAHRLAAAGLKPVLIDRGGRKLPFAANYTGITVETPAKQKVVVALDPADPTHDRVSITSAKS